MKQVLGVIPARGGAKRVPNKNIRDLCGKPLIAWTIKAALESGVIDRLIVSTDSPEIAEISRRWGAEVPGLRPAELSGDRATCRAVLEHVLRQWAPDGHIIVLVQATSPLRTSEDIGNAYDVFLQHNSHGAVKTMTEAPCPREWMVSLGADGRIPPPEGYCAETRSQDFPTRYLINGAVYIAAVDYFHKHGFKGPECYASIMPPERSVDIDTELDFAFAEYLARGKL